MAGCSGGYRAHVRAAPTSARARAVTARERWAGSLEDPAVVTDVDTDELPPHSRVSAADPQAVGVPAEFSALRDRPARLYWRAVHPVDLIRRKRDGGTLSRDELKAFVAAMTAGDVPAYQAAAFLMAVYWRGMTLDETAWLTDAMAGSGVRLDLAGLDRPAVDKHSTGGVGDKTSLIVAPLAAACGVAVPMLSGRAHATPGATYAKRQGIPGFRGNLAVAEIRRPGGEVGCVIAAQTDELAPADRILYALRDVTATVDSPPLICASILAKKLAEGVGGLVLDVKVGSGAFMKRVEDARALAERLVAVGAILHLRTEALLTDMSAPLGRAVGNALEVAEAIGTLSGRGPSDVEDLSVALVGRMLVLAGVARGEDDGRARAAAALASGAALDRFSRMVERQGGDASVVDDPAKLPQARCRSTVTSIRDGYVSALDALGVGRAVMHLGGGRFRADDAVDPAAGLLVRARVGELVRVGDPLVDLHTSDAGRLAEAERELRAAVTMADAPPPPRPLIMGHVG